MQKCENAGVTITKLRKLLRNILQFREQAATILAGRGCHKLNPLIILFYILLS